MSLAVKALLTPLLVAQALRTRARLPRLPEADGPRHGTAGDGPRLRLLVDRKSTRLNSSHNPASRMPSSA
jgi:hypothetical protein